MNWEAIGAVGELIGAVVVITTLVYLAVQIREGINSVQGANELEAAKLIAEWHARVTGSLELRTVYDKAAAGETLSDVERVQYTWLIAEIFLIAEGFYRQYKRGLISASSWEGLEMALVALLEVEALTIWWEQRLAPLSGEFRDHLNKARVAGSAHVIFNIREITKRGDDTP
jgi:hypothetical protein